jgi:hypothetical protein
LEIAMILIRRFLQCIATLTPLMLLASGCDVASALADKALPSDTIKAEYKGLQGQSVGVLVWIDRGLEIDYPSLNLDLANSIQKKLADGTDNSDLKGAIFPVQPASIARYMLDHPTFSTQEVTDFAPKFGVSRLVYVEVDDFGTRAPSSVELYRGHMEVTIHVVEVDGSKARVAYDRPEVRCSFPPKVPEDGTPDGDDVRFYGGTVDAMSTEVFNRLVSHENPDAE